MKPEDIRKALDNYIEWNKPDYAIMLTGGWGTGKTYFIKDYIETRKRAPHRKKMIYLSLYGIKNEAEIDGQILIRKVSSMVMIVIGVLIFIALCIAMYYRLEKTESIVNILFHGFGVLVLSVLLWHYRTYKEKSFEHILCKNDLIVFDDFERAEMSHKQLLAYINHFVEHLKKHVVIVCNKDEIKEDDSDHTNKSRSSGEQDSQSSQYNETENNPPSYSPFLKMKEKVIGKEIVLEQDSKNILYHLWTGGDFSRLKKAVNNEQLGFDWFVSVTTPQTIPVNYRVWKRCCRDYETTFMGIDESIICYPVVSQRLIAFFFPVCYGLQIHDFGNNQFFPMRDIRDLYRMIYDRNNPLKWFLEMFPFYRSAYSNVLNDLWNEILYLSKVDDKKIRTYLEKIVKEEESFMPMLHYYFQYDDSTVDNAWHELEKAFNSRSVTDPNEIALVVISILDMISSQCCPNSSLTACKVAAFTRLYCMHLDFAVENEDSFNSGSFFSMYSSRLAEKKDRDLLAKILNHLGKEVNSYIERKLIPERYHNLLLSLQDDDSFNTLWYKLNYRNINLFSGQDPMLLVNALIKSPIQSIRMRVLQILDNLTDIPFSTKPLLQYKVFKISLINCLQAVLNNPDIHLQRAQNYYFNVAIKKLSNNLKIIEERENNNPSTSTDKEPEQ